MTVARIGIPELAVTPVPSVIAVQLCLFPRSNISAITPVKPEEIIMS